GMGLGRERKGVPARVATEPWGSGYVSIVQHLTCAKGASGRSNCREQAWARAGSPFCMERGGRGVQLLLCSAVRRVNGTSPKSGRARSDIYPRSPVAWVGVRGEGQVSGSDRRIQDDGETLAGQPIVSHKPRVPLCMGGQGD